MRHFKAFEQKARWALVCLDRVKGSWELNHLFSQNATLKHSAGIQSYCISCRRNGFDRAERAAAHCYTILNMTVWTVILSRFFTLLLWHSLVECALGFRSYVKLKFYGRNPRWSRDKMMMVRDCIDLSLCLWVHSRQTEAIYLCVARGDKYKEDIIRVKLPELVSLSVNTIWLPQAQNTNCKKMRKYFMIWDFL